MFVKALQCPAVLGNDFIFCEVESLDLRSIFKKEEQTEQIRNARVGKDKMEKGPVAAYDYVCK